jgi:hypothetical protein
MCWPANVVGAFFVAVVIFDMVQKKYGDLPYHALAGVVLTFLFWLVCSFVSVSISAAILVVPTIFLGVFFFTVWFMDESLKQRGCCMNCDGACNKKKVCILKKKVVPKVCESTLTANTVKSSALE